jgi:hypothetical protein
MTIIHTDSAAIFGEVPINAAEERIQWVEHRPTLAYDADSSISFTIPGNSSQYVSLRDTYILASVKINKKQLTAQECLMKLLKSRKKGRSKRSAGSEPPKKRRKIKDGPVRIPRSVIDDDDEANEHEEVINADSEDEDEEEDLSPADNELEKEVEGISLTNKEYEVLLEEIISKFENKYDVTVVGDLNMRQQAAILEYTKDLNSVRFANTTDAIFHSMWNGCDVFMNHTLVSTSNTRYMYKSYIETILNNSESTKKFQLTAIGYTGNNGNANDPNIITSQNFGLQRRNEMFKDGKTVQLMGYLAADIMSLRPAIVNGVEITIKLYPNRNAVRLLTYPEDVQADFVLEDIVLKVCKKSMAPEVLKAHQEVMEKDKPARYPFKNAEVRSFDVPAGAPGAIIDNLYQTKIPARLIVGMVASSSYVGNYQENPLNFEHFNLANAGFYIDDEPVPKRPYNINPSKKLYIEPLMDLYSIMGKAGEDKDIGISQENYGEGLFLVPFDVLPTAAADISYLPKYEGGNCRLELTFSKPLPKAITVITYAIYPATLQIDVARNVEVIKHSA